MKKKKRTIPFKLFIRQPFIIKVGIILGRILPRKAGWKLATLIGTILGSRKKSPMVKAIRANQWVIHNQSLTEQELERLPKTIFQSASKCIFDYFYFISHPEKLKDVIDFSPEAERACERIGNNQASVCVCPHLSNFDLMGYALSLQDLEVQVLSFPNPNASYKMQNQLRESLGITVTPLTLSAFRQAKNRLLNGGSVLTGLDRPISDSPSGKHQPEFFGHTSNLPIGYVRLAKEVNAPVIIMAATSQPGGRYRLVGSDPIWIESGAHIEDEIIYNANRILKESEGLIKKYADQWAMFYPVWPQFLGK